MSLQKQVITRKPFTGKVVNWQVIFMRAMARQLVAKLYLAVALIIVHECFKPAYSAVLQLIGLKTGIFR